MASHSPDARPSPTFDQTTQLVLRDAQNGDRAAFGALFERVTPMLLSWVHLRTSAAFRGKIDPQDVVQEVWLRAMERLSKLDAARTPFRAWIFGVARYVLIETSRDLLRGRGSTPRATSSQLAAQPAAGSGVSTTIGREEAVARFVELAGGLRRENRELVVLRGLEGASFEEVARRLGGTPAAWEKRWQRLRARLRVEPVLEGLL